MVLRVDRSAYAMMLVCTENEFGSASSDVSGPEVETRRVGTYYLSALASTLEYSTLERVVELFLERGEYRGREREHATLFSIERVRE